MKSSDMGVALGVAVVLGVCSAAPGLVEGYNALTRDHDFLMSFIKFGLLCTFGESIALRITQKCYTRRGFGLLPRMLLWGMIGLVINAVFHIYAAGVPSLLVALGLPLPADALAGDSLPHKLALAFCISVAINLLFAPLFMTAHSVVTMHIVETGGTLKGFFSPIDVGKNLRRIDWDMLWGFVFKKTLPLFWIPCHTVTFLLPPELRVLFAAALGVVLGVILAFASLKSVQRPVAA